jgi:hypothetical protein
MGYEGQDRRKEDDSIALLHSKMDDQTQILKELKECMYGDPKKPDSKGMKHIQMEHGDRIKTIESRHKWVFGAVGISLTSVIGAWAVKLWGPR